MKDSASFDTFYQGTARRVLLHVYAGCGNLGDAQDAVQEAYARAWQRWSRVSGYDNPEGWVRLVAWRIAINRWRDTRRWLTARSRLGPPVAPPEPSPDTVAVLAALRRLPEPQRRAVVLYEMCGLSVAEVATATNAPVGTVKARLSRARAALATLLADTAEEATNAC